MYCCSELSCGILKYEGKVRSIKGKWEAALCKTRFLTLSDHNWVVRIIFPRFPCHYLDSFLNTKPVSWHLTKMIKTTTCVSWPIDGWAPEYQYIFTDWVTKHQRFLVSTKFLSSKTLEWMLRGWSSTFHSDPPYVQRGVLISLLTRQNQKICSSAILSIYCTFSRHCCWCNSLLIRLIRCENPAVN